MIITRNIHQQFLKDELQAQIEEFKKTLDTSAIDLLLEKNFVFVAMFIKFIDNGEMLLKFNASRPLPRKNDYLYCFTLPESLRRYRDWGNLSYGDLIKKETQASEVKCVWHSNADDSKFMLAGFKGVSEEFKQYVEKAPGGIVTLGPQVPPYEYLSNLEKVSHSEHPKCKQVLDEDYVRSDWNPTLLDSNIDMTEIVASDFRKSDIVIVQGPPGTGKTYRIANICRDLCAQNKSVLVTALTNRALMEVADKLKESQLMKSKGIFKTNLSADESREVPGIQSSEKMHAIPGRLMLSTFYISSGAAANNYEGPLFDYVIVDEASQAFLPMLAAANMLGYKNLWVGDVKQMPPIVIISRDRVTRLGYTPTIEGLDTVTSSCKYKTYQLSDTYRLGNRAASFTGLFYNNTLKSKSDLNGLFENQDGPILIPVDMPIGDPMPMTAIHKAASIAKDMLEKNKKLEIAILAQLIKTTKALQVEVTRQMGASNNILVETVARVQGITVDYTIYVIPDTDAKLHSFELRLFNVATSRTRRNTYIICPRNIMNYPYMSPLVRKYLSNLLS
jgi:DNA replication ATP-dependent helicase Dna2